MFKRINNNINLATQEQSISSYWDEINAFDNSMQKRKNGKVFRDGNGTKITSYMNKFSGYEIKLKIQS